MSLRPARAGRDAARRRRVRRVRALRRLQHDQGEPRSLPLECVRARARPGCGNYLLASSSGNTTSRASASRHRRLDSLLVFLSGFVLTITPGKVGEVFKSAVLAKTHGVPAERTAPIVVAERLTDAIGVIVADRLGSGAFAGGLAGPSPVRGRGRRARSSSCGSATRALARLARKRRGGLSAGIAPKLRAALVSLRSWPDPRRCSGPDRPLGGRLGRRGRRALRSCVGFSAAGAARRRDVLLLDGNPGRRADSGAGRPRRGRRHAARAARAPGRRRAGRRHRAMILVRFATLWWAVSSASSPSRFCRLRFPAELGRASRRRRDEDEQPGNDDSKYRVPCACCSPSPRSVRHSPRLCGGSGGAGLREARRRDPATDSAPSVGQQHERRRRCGADDGRRRAGAQGKTETFPDAASLDALAEARRRSGWKASPLDLAGTHPRSGLGKLSASSSAPLGPHGARRERQRPRARRRARIYLTSPISRARPARPRRQRNRRRRRRRALAARPRGAESAQT